MDVGWWLLWWRADLGLLLCQGLGLVGLLDLIVTAYVVAVAVLVVLVIDVSMVANLVVYIVAFVIAVIAQINLCVSVARWIAINADDTVLFIVDLVHG